MGNVPKLVLAILEYLWGEPWTARADSDGEVYMFLRKRDKARSADKK